MDGLRQTTLTARPLLNAIKRFRIEKGRVPNTLNELYPTFLKPSTLGHDSTGTSWGKWRYLPDGSSSYRLYYKINWDAGILFSSNEPIRWVFEPGDGRQSTTIVGP
jgi:hypothetical protein